ncbi:MAG: hypothetical protein ROM03_04270 [Mucispirillum sp.]|nr:hypothetical protein [Mucispirillum sp.]
MGILKKNVELENGIVTDLYYRMPSYQADDKGIRCKCIVYSSLEKRKQGQGVVYPEIFVNIVAPKEKDVTKMNTEEMYLYVYELLTEALGGTAELEYSATEEAEKIVAMMKGDNNAE